MARRERIMMLEPFSKGLMGTTLLYPYEIRGEDAAFEDIPDVKLPDQMVKLAEAGRSTRAEGKARFTSHQRLERISSIIACS